MVKRPRGEEGAEAEAQSVSRPKPAPKPVAEKPKSVFRSLLERVALPIVRQVVVPSLAKKALLDHDVVSAATSTPGVPAEVARCEPALQHPAEILRDQYGVPHIYTKCSADLFFLQGVTHAEDRLFQMELTRRLYSGSLAEFAGEKALSIDKFAKTLGWERLAAKGIGLLRRSRNPNKPQVLTLLTKYVEGLNVTIAALKKKGQLPWEFKIAKIQPREWTVQDVLGIMYVVAFKMSFGFQAPLVRHYLHCVAGGDDPNSVYNKWFSRDTAEEVEGPETVESSQWHLDKEELVQAYIRAILSDDSNQDDGSGGGIGGILHPQPGQGSNAWCIHPTHTAEGEGTLLANDPHLETGVPTFFYESHLCSQGKSGSSDDIHFAGMTVPGFPGMVLPGHNGDVAWGVTLSMCDVEDVYVELFVGEEDNRLGFPLHYQSQGRKKEVEVFEHEIRVAGRKEPVRYVSGNTVHGPIISSLGHGIQPAIDNLRGAPTLPEERYEIAFTARHLGEDLYKNLFVFYDVLRSNSAEAARRNFSKLISPSLNICIADRFGDIAYTLAGEVPLRNTPPGSEGFPLCGWTGEARWTGMVSGDDLPHTINPAKGFVVSANHKVIDFETTEYPHYLGDLWQDPYRAQTIHDCLNARILSNKALDVKTCEKIQGCVDSKDAGLEFVSHFKGMHFKDELVRAAVKEMRAWKGELSKDSVGGCIYKVVFTFCLHNLFQLMLLEAKEEAKENGKHKFLEDALVGHGMTSVLKAFNEFKGKLMSKTLHFLRVCDEEDPEDQRKRDALTQAAEEGVQWLARTLGPQIKDWRWGRLHQMKLEHPLSAKLNMPELNTQFPFGGDSTTPCQATYDLALDAEGNPKFSVEKGTGAVAACRVVFCPSHWDKSTSVLTGGQSAKWLSRHYADQVNLFRASKGKKMLWSRKKVEDGCIFKANYATTH